MAVLLVDSEEPFVPVTGTPQQKAQARVAHLSRRDLWDFEALAVDRVHLVVQCMEAWIVADPDALEEYYGQGFARKLLPVRANLEEEPKLAVYSKLERATENTQKKAYGKIKHASQLLARISPGRVVQRCPHFSIFTEWLDEVIAPTS